MINLAIFLFQNIFFTNSIYGQLKNELSVTVSRRALRESRETSPEICSKAEACSSWLKVQLVHTKRSKLLKNKTKEVLNYFTIMDLKVL